MIITVFTEAGDNCWDVVVVICSLTNLESLEIRDNALCYLPSSTATLINLRFLDVGGNLLEQVVSQRTLVIVSVSAGFTCWLKYTKFSLAGISSCSLLRSLQCFPGPIVGFGWMTEWKIRWRGRNACDWLCFFGKSWHWPPYSVTHKTFSS